MDGDGGRRGKIKAGALILLVLVGIALLGSSGVVGLLVLAIAMAIAIVMVRRA